MADTTLSIGVIAELDAFKRSLAELPGIGAQEARDLAAGIRRELRSAERAAASSATATSSSWKAELASIELAAKKAFERVGGTIGPVGSGLIDLTKSLGSVGVAAGALGATGGGLALVGLGLDYLVDAAVAADGRLTELGITTAQHDSIMEYSAATKDLGIALDELTVAVGGEIADDLTVLVHAVTSGVQAFGDFRDQTEGLREGLDLLLRAVVAVSSLGMSELAISTLDAASATAELRVGTDGLTEAQRLEIEAQQDVIEGARQNAIARQAEAEATRAAADAARAAKEQAAEDQRQLDAVWQARIAWYRAVSDAAEATAASEQAASAATRAQLIADNQAVLDETQAILDARQAASAAYEEAQKGSDLRLASSVAGYVDMVAGEYARLLDVVVGNYEARLAAGENFNRQEEQAYRLAVAARKALAVTQAIVDSVVVFSGVTANLAPSLGPYAPLAGGAIATAVLTASLAAIAAEHAVDYADPWAGESAAPGSGTGNNAPGALQPGYEGPTKGENSAAPTQVSQRTGGMTLTIDPRLRRLQVVDSSRVGKRVRSGP